MSLGNTVGTHLNLWNTLGTHLEYTWNTFGIHLEYTWNTLGIHLEHTFSRDIPVFLDLGLRWPGWTGNTVGIQVWITGRISGFEEHTWDISFWENGCLSISDIHTEHGLEKSLSGIHLEVPFEHTNSIHLEHKKNILDISNVWLLWVVVTLRNQNIQSWRDTSPTHYENSTLWWNTNNCLVVSNVHIHRYNLVGGLEPVFSILYGIIIPTDFLIFHRGRYTTKQIYISSNSKRFFFCGLTMYISWLHTVVLTMWV